MDNDLVTMRRILEQFDELGSESLDLHALLESGGNDPAAREQVIDLISKLVEEGLLEERGSDFYALTAKGRASLLENRSSLT